MFNKNFDINQLNDIFSDVPIAYESILPIKRDKLLDTQLLLKHLQIPTEEKFDETLFSNESAVTSKNKALINDYINKNIVIEHKSRILLWTFDFWGERQTSTFDARISGTKQLQIKHIFTNLNTFWISQNAGQRESCSSYGHLISSSITSVKSIIICLTFD